MKRENAFLLAYYIALLLPPLGDYRHTALTLLAILASLVLFWMYRSLKDESFFYFYNFVALLGIVLSLGNYNPYYPITLGVAYALLSLLLLHMTYARFHAYFGTVTRETLFYTLLTIPISFLSVYLFLIYPVGYGFLGFFVLSVVIIAGIALLMRSSESK